MVESRQAGCEGLGVSLTWFPHARTSRGQRVDVQWSYFVRTFGPHQIGEQKIRCPLISPSIFTDDTRSIASALAVSLGVADFDDITDETLDSIRQTCTSLNLEYLLYTTWSHAQARSKNLNRVRIIIPLSRPVDATEWIGFWARFVQMFQGALDTQCKDVSHVFFGPYVSTEQELPLAWIEHRTGVPLDTDLFLSVPVDLAILAAADEGTQEIPRDVLSTLARKLSKKSSELDQTIGSYLKKVLDGEAFAQPGNIDNTLFAIAKVLAREMPFASPASLAQHFAPSLQLMAHDWPQYAMTVEQAEDKIRRQQIKLKEEKLAKQHLHLEQQKVRTIQAFRSVGIERSEPYTDVELKGFQSIEQCSPSEMQKRWVIRCGNAIYFYVAGRYVGPASTTSDAGNWAEQMLAPARSIGVSPYQIQKNGDILLKTTDKLVSDHGQIAKQIIIDTSADRSYFDPEHAEIVEAPFHLRVKPKFDPMIDRFLDLLGGPKAQLLKDWIALLPDLTIPIPLLFLYGAGGAGKSLLTHGLARIWNMNGPTTLNEAVGSFNDALLKNPLLFGDEELPVDHRGRVRTDTLRELIQSRSRPLKRKFLPVATMRGAVRLIAAANDDGLFSQSGDMSATDIDAYSERLLMIDVGGVSACPARDFLKVTPHHDWVDGDKIAAHAMYLALNNRPKVTSRFGVVDTDKHLRNALTTRTGARFTVALFFARYLANPKAVDNSRKYGIVRYKGHLYAQSRVVQDYWDVYLPSEQCPKAYQISRVITGLSTSRVKLKTPVGQQQYRKIDLDIIRSFAEENDEGTAEQINSMMSTDNIETI